MTTHTNDAPVTVDAVRYALQYARNLIGPDEIIDAALASAPAGDGVPTSSEVAEAIRIAREQADKVYGVRWMALEEISRHELVAAALAPPRAAVGERGLLEQARDAIKDMLREDDGQAWKEARKLLPRLDAALQSPPAKVEPSA